MLSSLMPELLDDLRRSAARVTPKAQLCGIYFLFLGDDLVYVGKSFNVLRRIGDHAEGLIEFDRACWIRTPKSTLAESERRWLDILLPSANSDQRTVALRRNLRIV